MCYLYLCIGPATSRQFTSLISILRTHEAAGSRNPFVLGMGWLVERPGCKWKDKRGVKTRWTRETTTKHGWK